MNQPPPDSYSTDPAWADIIPVPQDDGPNPLAQIAYSEEYSEATSYLRAIMSKSEHSPRVLQITAHVIEMNPAHYTVWLYRAKTLLAISADLGEELEFLNSLALRHQKNYQIWNHRQVVVESLGSVRGEKEFMASMFERDSKNYHVWSYRQWVVRRFAGWAGELEFVDGLLGKDVRNNSAWNHRFFVLFGQAEGEGGSGIGDEVVDREVRYVEDAIFVAPQNESPWNYIRGVLKKVNRPLSTVEEMCLRYAPLDKPDGISSSHALDLLADIYAERKEEHGKAIKALELLASKYDPIRANYWNYRASIIKAAS